MMRNAWLQDNHPVMVGVMGACPDGDGFNARFENFSIRHLPDMRRVEWLKKNSAENSREAVDELTGQLRSDGYTILSGPRTTGDGCYESAVADPEGNHVEITV